MILYLTHIMLRIALYHSFYITHMRDTVSRYITHISHLARVNISRNISRTYHAYITIYH